MTKWKNSLSTQVWDLPTYEANMFSINLDLNDVRDIVYISFWKGEELRKKTQDIVQRMPQSKFLLSNNRNMESSNEDFFAMHVTDKFNWKVGFLKKI